MTNFHRAVIAALTVAVLPSCVCAAQTRTSDFPTAFTAPKNGYDYVKRIEMVQVQSSLFLLYDRNPQTVVAISSTPSQRIIARLRSESCMLRTKRALSVCRLCLS